MRSRITRWQTNSINYGQLDNGMLNPQEYRKRVRPNKNWRCSVLKENGKSIKEMRVLGKNHIQWRAHIVTLCSWWISSYIIIIIIIIKGHMIKLTCTELLLQESKEQLHDKHFLLKSFHLCQQVCWVDILNQPWPHVWKKKDVFIKKMYFLKLIQKFFEVLDLK